MEKNYKEATIFVFYLSKTNQLYISFFFLFNFKNESFNMLKITKGTTFGYFCFYSIPYTIDINI